ncbi:MAG: type II toxin-antitoxin system RelE/ParE family toxin [Planctomycetes bacterium]|nr:type II toxin-antitoxin system RelE/ParE family toxin [Planctomycetota bacterium]
MAKVRRYRVEFAPAALRALRALPRDVQRRLRPRIDALTEDPRPAGARKLSGAETLYRVRAGEYRVVYAVEDDRLLVLVVRIGHRRDVYR